MVRNLKAQMERDISRVFLGLGDFASLADIRYWRNGSSRPPECKRISVIVRDDANMNSVWNKNKSQASIGNDQVIYQVDKTLYISLADFSPAPKKGRKLELDGDMYEVLSVEKQGGLLKIELRETEE